MARSCCVFVHVLLFMSMDRPGMISTWESGSSCPTVNQVLFSAAAKRASWLTSSSSRITCEVRSRQLETARSTPLKLKATARAFVKSVSSPSGISGSCFFGGSKVVAGDAQ
ncbi:hypothetical protein ACFFX0_25605 [Citricoccus parietis]|uniref:Secreted protein n=1 Tax=Citricoccus parietis TaxID=592307 RepID=A0ABV5G608_9MICC